MKRAYLLLLLVVTLIYPFISFKEAIKILRLNPEYALYTIIILTVVFIVMLKAVRKDTNAIHLIESGLLAQASANPILRTLFIVLSTTCTFVSIVIALDDPAAIPGRGYIPATFFSIIAFALLKTRK